jgi:hypothetical protein
MIINCIDEDIHDSLEKPSGSHLWNATIEKCKKAEQEEGTNDWNLSVEQNFQWIKDDND